MESADRDAQNELKEILQTEGKPSDLEHLGAALISRLLNVPVAVARGGFQHGGDAGPAGQHGRRFRIECKRYQDTTSLDDRELQGEIDDALRADEALEAWILVSTRVVTEQTVQKLILKGERLGVPVLIIDWRDDDLAPLAALCAYAPDVLEQYFPGPAASLARRLRPVAQDALKSFEREFQSWCLGFKALRTLSHEKLNEVWTSPREANAAFGQNAAGGSQHHRIRRKAIHAGLDGWWQTQTQTDAPATVVGWDGVGKTWASLDWLVDRRDQHPITLIVPSSAVAPLTSASETALKQFLGTRLHELTGVRDAEHWTRRLDRLLQRPSDEGPVITLFLDGLNQEASAPWLGLFKQLQSKNFTGRIRVMSSVRTHFFEDRLARLKGLIVAPQRIDIGPYDMASGGEFDEMLAFEKLARTDLPPDLIEQARTPRLFKLVVQFRDRFVEAGNITPYRLLWEYGCDRSGERAGRSFTEEEWREWLQEVANNFRSGLRAFSSKTLSEQANRPDRSPSEVYSRLSEIIDGRFVTKDISGRYQLSPILAAYGLALALLSDLESSPSPDSDVVTGKLDAWLDPIAGLDERAEILRAAVSILIERAIADTALAGVLVTAWLQTQNVPDQHRQELVALASELVDPLLDAIARSPNKAQASARSWAMHALRGLPKVRGKAYETILSRATLWLSRVSRMAEFAGNETAERRHLERLKRTLGTDQPGRIDVLSVPLELVDEGENLHLVVPSLLEGFPLANALSCFERAAMDYAIRGYTEVWGGLRWIVHLNEVDPRETNEQIRAVAGALPSRPKEPGLAHNFSQRVAALLLCLSGLEVDEDASADINKKIPNGRSYEEEYLDDPVHSPFQLERRHAEQVLKDTSLPLLRRIQKVSKFWPDPSFAAPSEFIDEIAAAADHFDVEKLYRDRSFTPEEHNFEVLQPALARCAPDRLAALHRRWLQSLSRSSSEARYWSALRATNSWLLARPEEGESAHTLQMRARDSVSSDEAIASSRLVALELRALATLAQFRRVLECDLAFIPSDLGLLLNRPSPEDVDLLITEYSAASTKQQHDLIVLLSVHCIEFSEMAWSWLVAHARDKERSDRGVLFRLLAKSDAEGFGRLLLADGWSWQPDADMWINHYGSLALIEATSALPFDQIVQRIAPWRVLEAARLRGSDAIETLLAAEVVVRILNADGLAEPDLGSDLVVERPGDLFHYASIAAEPRPDPKDRDDPFAAMKRNLDDPQARVREYQRAGAVARSRSEAVRQQGGSLFLANVKMADIEASYLQTPEIWKPVIEGHSAKTSDFRRRLILAEECIFALCEVLLKHEPGTGVSLWKSIRVLAQTKRIGGADIDETLHMIFRVPDSTPVLQAREELLSLAAAPTDQALFQVAIAAGFHCKSDWLQSMIAHDRACEVAWRRKRAEVLDGFTVFNPLPTADAWASGPAYTDHETLRRSSAIERWNEAFARHWWNEYLDAENDEQAFAAWTVFLDCVDQRAGIWMSREAEGRRKSERLDSRRIIHANLNRAIIDQKIRKATSGQATYYLRNTIGIGVGPWA
ncbi:MAG: hypothetical protein JSR99_11895 [Proteobacteria bacterium]|nr:hypothetical protein [Pseudomonadota bacterium]